MSTSTYTVANCIATRNIWDKTITDLVSQTRCLEWKHSFYDTSSDSNHSAICYACSSSSLLKWGIRHTQCTGMVITVSDCRLCCCAPSIFGNGDSNLLFSRHTRRCCLMSLTSNRTSAGVPLKSNSVKNAMAKTPRSFLFGCCCTCWTKKVISAASVWRIAAVCFWMFADNCPPNKLLYTIMEEGGQSTVDTRIQWFLSCRIW